MSTAAVRVMVALAALSTASMAAPVKRPAGRMSGTRLSRQDSTFVRKAAQGGISEVTLGKLVASKASSPEVKAFGQRMVDDHTKANNDLKSVAARLGVRLPTRMSPEGSAMLARLKRMSGAAFDHAYVMGMVQDHRTDVKEFTQEANRGRNAAVKAFAQRTLPVLKSHLKSIESIHGGMKGGPMGGMRM